MANGANGHPDIFLARTIVYQGHCLPWQLVVQATIYPGNFYADKLAPGHIATDIGWCNPFNHSIPRILETLWFGHKDSTMLGQTQPKLLYQLQYFLMEL